jgi:hypothetical protein
MLLGRAVFKSQTSVRRIPLASSAVLLSLLLCACTSEVSQLNSPKTPTPEMETRAPVNVQAPVVVRTPVITSTPVVASTAFDPFPYDTNNDGQDNDVDPDDDGDGVLDAADNCALTPNAGQSDLDGDGIGDYCDLDRDGDSLIDYLEQLFGSDPTDPASTIEYVGLDEVCVDSMDNDLDGNADAADTGCLDGDGDGVANTDDNCPSEPNSSQVDRDQNDVGDSCELSIRINYVGDYFLNSRDVSRIGWLANERATFTVVVGSDCSSGAVVDSGLYDPGPGGAEITAFVNLQADDLAEGWNSVTVCGTARSHQTSDSVEILKDTQAPDTIIASGPLQGSVSASEVTFVLDSSEPAGFECSLDGGSFKECESPQGYKGLSPGLHSFRVRAWDAASNFDATPATRSWTVSP